jgi:toxin FitB
LTGKTLAVADGLIAATARDHDLVIVTRNIKDFSAASATVFNPRDE